MLDEHGTRGSTELARDLVLFGRESRRDYVAVPVSRDGFFFRLDGDVFVGSDAARGPWAVDACHAGPVTAVMARGAEALAADKQLTRLTVVFDRPIPMGGFRVVSTVERRGRSVVSAAIRLVDLEERVCARAATLHLATHNYAGLPTATVDSPDFREAMPGDFPVERATHDRPFFSSGIDVAYPPGERGDPGPTTVWMRTVPIVAGEAPSAFQSLCPLADCGNGISRNAEITEASCINADLTINAFRLPKSDWLASQARSFWEPSGVGLSHAMLYDEAGCVGTALQTLMVAPVGAADD